MTSLASGPATSLAPSSVFLSSLNFHYGIILKVTVTAWGWVGDFLGRALIVFSFVYLSEAYLRAQTTCTSGSTSGMMRDIMD